MRPAPTGNEHLDVSAYALGALTAADATRYERHLAHCQQCRVELDRLTPLVALMSYVDPSVLAPAPAGFPDPTGAVGPDGGHSTGSGQRKRPVRSHRWRTGTRRRLWATAAAVAIFAAGGLTAAGAVLATRPARTAGPPAVVAASATEHRAVDAGTGVDATVLVGDRPWGSSVILRLTRVNGPQTCHLVAVSKSGQRESLVGWRVPAAGYGTAAQPNPLVLQGATYLGAADIERFEVRTSSDTLLVSVPV